MRTLSVFGLLLSWAALSSTSWAAPTPQRKKPPVPDLTDGGQPDGKHDWNLGPTGARGWIWGWRLETSDARQILITEVAPRSPADGVLAVGDVVVGVAGRPFSSDPRRVLGEAIVRAEGELGEGRLPLLIWRDGETSSVTLSLPVLGDYGDRAPWDCVKSDRVLGAACAHIAANMKGDIDGMMNALALLATGREEHLDAVRALARKVGDPGTELTLLGRSSGLFAWEWGYRNLFLCEYFLATRDRAVMPAILEYSQTIAEGQSGVGTWGHGMAWPDLNEGKLHGSLGGYGALNQAGLVCHLSLVLAKKCGVKSEEVSAAVERANAFAAFYAGKGAIPYGDHRPGWDAHDDNGKNSLAALIFDLQGQSEEADFFAKMTVASYGERERGHTGNYFSYLWGAMGAGRAGPDAAAAFLAEQRWFYDLARTWRGGFVYQGGAGMEGSEHKYGGWDCTGAFVLGHTLPLARLYITGRDRDSSRDLDLEGVADAIECGRGFDAWTRGAAFYNELGEEDLLGRLKSWSPAVRSRAGRALSERQNPPVETLLARLDGDDLYARYGACQALGMLGPKGAQAVPALRTALGHDDVWMRIQAAYALAGVGDEARAAAPDMLRLAVRDDPGDPREFTQRYLAFCLFYRGGALGMQGLLSRSLEGIDRELLLPAVKRLLLNDDGRARAALATVYKNLSLKELVPILPEIVEAIRTPSPSGVMFSNGIRLSGVDLLAKHRIAEGMALSLELTEIHKWGKKDRVRKAIRSLASYGGAARAVLPELRQLRADLADHREAKSLAALIELCDKTVLDLESSEEGPVVHTLEEVLGR